MQQLSVMSVLVDEAEFTNPELASEIDVYPVVYIKSAEGGYRMRRKVKGGKYMVLPVQKLPGQSSPAGVTTNPADPNAALIKARKAMMQVNTDILPSGKIPVAILHQIVAFFISVMNNKMKDVVVGAGRTAGSWQHEYEAMAHIIWNEHTKQYRVGIPTQRVSKASVSYDHDDYDAAAGDMVIVDIHSHNTMSAFFSGTDNNDDRGAYCYSGVIGNLDKNPTMKFRLNAGELKVEMDAHDIFDFNPKLPPVSEEWLNKVTVQGYSYGGGYQGRGGYGGGAGWPTPGTPAWYQMMGDDDDYDIITHDPRGGGKNRTGRFPRSRQGNSTVAKEIDDALTKLIKEGQLPKDTAEALAAAGIDVESFLEGLTAPVGAPHGFDHVEDLGDMFDPNSIHEPGEEFTKLVKAYCGLAEINTDTYTTLHTLGIYEEIQELAKVWEASADANISGLSLINRNTGITVTSDNFIEELSPLKSYFDDMLDAEELSDNQKGKYAHDVWELIFDLNSGLAF